MSVELAQRVLAAKEDPFALLSLAPSLPPVTHATPVPDARRNYMRLAQMIHPDRLADYDKATEAFQALVKAMEAVVNPPKVALPRRRAAPAAKPSKKPPPKKAAKKKKRRVESEDEIEVSSEDEQEEEEEASSEEETPVAAPEKKASNVLMAARDNTNCFRTPIGCPRCRNPWVPDDNKQYTLFMAHSAKVHCDTCLLQFGCATAIHGCPRCRWTGIEYDPSMYNKQVSCGKCHNSFGFMAYPISEALIAAVREKEELEERAEADKAEREARAAKRRGGVADTPQQEDLTMKIGQCMIEDECPICHKQVKSKHKQHVVECAKNPPPAKKARQVRVFVVDDMKPRAKAAPRAKRAQPKATGSKRRRSKYSDSEDSDYNSD